MSYRSIAVNYGNNHYNEKYSRYPMLAAKVPKCDEFRFAEYIGHCKGCSKCNEIKNLYWMKRGSM